MSLLDALGRWMGKDEKVRRIMDHDRADAREQEVTETLRAARAARLRALQIEAAIRARGDRD